MNTAIKTTTPDTTDTTSEPSLTFEQMYSECQDYCEAIAHRTDGSLGKETIYDLVADSFERLYRKWETVQPLPAQAQKAYLANIVKHIVIDHARRRKLERATLVNIDDVEATLKAGRHVENDVEIVDVIVYRANGRTLGTDDPERIMLAREDLREYLDTGARPYAGHSKERMRQCLLAELMGYSYSTIAHVQGRSVSAIKMKMMRAKRRVRAQEVAA